ncbi:hypothetical protein EKO04_009691 [Ascochyta lentis]|uniref:Uncharacterized protein n=1 Tax=Ascochyta lentis TaxID=205686 RepID=A0A8H7IX81_9PLEO|nr:hypothetical protein EKO04_009691 [Ascochyta lentis]
MLFIGGQISNVSLTECDIPKIGGQHGLLLGQEATEEGVWWHAIQDNTTGYRVPDKIVSLVRGNNDGNATATVPAAGFASRDLSVYFGTTASAAPRTASRIIPATSIPKSRPKTKSNKGAIAGGVVGGVVGLAATIGMIFFCLRRRRHSKPVEPNRAELAHSPAVDPNSPAMKRGANQSINGNSMESPMVEAPAYSPQGFPPPNLWSSEHQANCHQGIPPQQRGYDIPQAYYPPPPEPPQSASKHQNPQDVSHELPSTSTPAISELSHLRSPIPKRAGF